MTVTREVVKDLLTVYLADEASPDTRALVDEWLRRDPELATQFARAREGQLPAVEAPPPSIERRALDRTKRHLRGRSIVLGGAIYFSTLPFSVVFGSDGFQGLFLEDWTARLPVIAVAAVLWVVYWRMSRRLPVP